MWMVRLPGVETLAACTLLQPLLDLSTLRIAAAVRGTQSNIVCPSFGKLCELPKHAARLPLEDGLALGLVPLLALRSVFSRRARELGAELHGARTAIRCCGAAELSHQRDSAPPRQRCGRCRVWFAHCSGMRDSDMLLGW